MFKQLLINVNKQENKMDKDRAKKLDTVFSQIEKQFGEGSLMKLGLSLIHI